MKNMSRLALAALLLVVVAVTSAAWQEPGTAAPIGASDASISPQSSGLLISFGSHSPSVNPQTVPVEGGLTVSAIGSVTVAADEAYVVVIPERIFSSSGGEQMTVEDRQQIRENLVEIGLPEESVEFESLSRYEPPSIVVEVALNELDEKREDIIDAVEEVIRRTESRGILYTLTEASCESAMGQARREAIPRAERAADDLANALGVERGAVIGALEYQMTNSVYGLSALNLRACGAQASAPYPNLAPFDAEPEVEVTVGLQITYGIQ